MHTSVCFAWEGKFSFERIYCRWKNFKLHLSNTKRIDRKAKICSAQVWFAFHPIRTNLIDRCNTIPIWMRTKQLQMIWSEWKQPSTVRHLLCMCAIQEKCIFRKISHIKHVVNVTSGPTFAAKKKGRRSLYPLKTYKLQKSNS